MTIHFKYKILPDKFTNDTKKPIVRLTLSGNNKIPIDVIALLDSGADVSVIPKGLAEFLNLDFKEKTVSKGIGGEIQVWNSVFNISVRDIHQKYYFKNIPVQIAKDDTFPIILGRAGFFKEFEILIDEKNQKVKLKKNQEKPY